MITVIIPAYNAEKTICRCLESVVKQSVYLEIILVDDGSTDNTLKTVRPYTDIIKVISLTHGGVSKARNAGLDAAKGEWVLFLDADDELCTNALKTMEKHMIDGVDAICGAIWRGRDRITPIKSISCFIGNDVMDYVLADPTNRLTIHAWVFRKKQEMPCFDSELRIGEDSDWVLRYLCKSQKTMFIPVPVYNYTISAGSTVHKWREGQEQDYLRMINKISLGTVAHEKNWPLFVLTNYLLLLTHVLFHPDNPNSTRTQIMKARQLRTCSVFDIAFDKANLKDVSWPKRIVLECLKRKMIIFAYIAVKIRQKQNNRMAVD